MMAILDFEDFLRNLKQGQPLHRLILAQDDVRGVLRDQDPRNVQYAPQMMKARQMEMAQRLTQAPQPHMAPSLGPGPAAATPTLNLQNMAPKPPANSGGES